MTDEVIVFGLLVFYKVTTLLVGLFFAYMGYRLFLADKTRPAGDFQASAGEYGFSLTGGAPGVFFSLFGTVLICFSIFKGVEYKHTPSAAQPEPAVERIIPDRPPFDFGVKK